MKRRGSRANVRDIRKVGEDGYNTRCVQGDDAAREDPVERAEDDERARMCCSEQGKEHCAGAKARQEVCSESADAVACVASYDSTEGRRCVDDCKLRVMDEQGEDRV